MPKSYVAANNYINSQYRNVAYTPPTTIYLGLYTALPTQSGGGTEVSGGSYLRQPIAFSAPVNGVASNSADVLFPSATADWGTILGYGYFDAVSGGNLLSFNPFGASRVILNGDILRLPSSQMTITES